MVSVLQPSNLAASPTEQAIGAASSAVVVIDPPGILG
jgi:hypothetical protein